MSSGASPEIARSSSCWPLPDTPAMPTISPARTSSSMSLRSTPKGSALARDSPATCSRVSPPSAALAWRGTGSSSPIIIRAIEAGVSLAGTQRPVTRPARSTVAEWQSSRISSSLWLM